MCDLNNLICPACGTQLKVKGLTAEIVNVRTEKISVDQSGKTSLQTKKLPSEKITSVDQSGKTSITDEDRKFIVKAYVRSPLAFSSAKIARKLGLRRQQVAAVKAHCHSNLGGKGFIRRYS